MNDKQLKTVPVPQRIFEDMIIAYREWEKFANEFEDFLLGSDKKFVEKMRKARKEHLRRKTRDLKILKQELR